MPNEEPRKLELWIRGSIENGETDDRIIRRLRAAGPVDEIHLYLNSPGGHVTAMLRIATALADSKAKLITYCEGEAASAAMALFLLGHERCMSPAGRLMLHNVNCGGDETDPLASNLSEALCDLITAQTNATREEVRAWMGRTTYADFGESLALGWATGRYIVAGREEFSVDGLNRPFRMTLEEHAEAMLVPLNEKYDRLMQSFNSTPPAKKMELVKVPPIPGALMESGIFSQSQIPELHRRLSRATQAVAKSGQRDVRQLMRCQWLKKLLGMN